MLFKKNIQALSSINPNLANILSGLQLDTVKENIAVFNAESGDLIISLDEQPLDSIYDPVREAKTIWNKNVKDTPNRNDIQIVFGLGLGYLFKRVYVSCDSRILLYEPNINILRFVLEYIDFAKEIKDKRVYITSEYDDCLHYLGEKFLSGDKLNLLFSKYYATISHNILLKLSSDVYKICEQKNFDTNTILNMTKMWAHATVDNIMRLKDTTHFGALEGKFAGKTALIASPGPSLQENIDIIKENRDKFVLISVNRALKPLLANGIKPDFTAFMDVRDVTANMEEIQDQLKELNLINEIRTTKFAYEAPSASKFVYLTQNTWVGSDLNKTFGEIKTFNSAGSVSIICYYIAKALGCKNIIFAGLDLAFKGEMAYTKGDDLKITESPFTNFLNIKGKDGALVKTRSDYAAFARQLEQIIEQENDSNVYNTTSFGAYIEGMHYKPLDEILEGAPKIDLDVNKIVKDAYDENKELWKKAKLHLKQVLQNEKILAENLKDTVEPCLLKTRQLVAELNQPGVDVQILLGLQQKGLSIIVSELVKSQILFSYYQKELLEYSNINSKDYFTDNTILKKIKQKELELIENLNSVLPIFIAAYDVVIAKS
jgi:hypothetical protein